MLSGLSTSSNALTAFQTSLDNTSNNLANVNTTGFKRSVVNFQDLVYTGMQNLQVGTGSKVGSITPKGFAQGTITATGRNTDVALNGTGFLVVQMPDGSFQYTRDGSFSQDATGRLVTSQGYLVQPPITFPSDTTSITIGPDGTVTVNRSSAPNAPKVLGQLQVASFVNQEGLMIQPGNLYSETSASGPPTLGTAGSNGLGQIQQGSLEQSNVDLTTELTSLVSTQQAYVANSKAVTTANQMLTSSLALIS